MSTEETEETDGAGRVGHPRDEYSRRKERRKEGRKEEKKEGA